VAYLVAIIIILFFLFSAIKRITEYDRAVIFRLGRLLPNPKGPGIVLVFPIVDQVTRVSLRTETLDVPPQDIITRDNVTATVSAVVYYRVVDPSRALVKVNNYRFATSQFAQTTLRSVLGEVEFDDLLASRDKINARLQTIVDERTETWGVKVENVEIKTVDLPQELQRAIARQAEAERERRAKIIHADGEFAAAQKLADASAVMAKEPIALQLRYLQTLTEIGTEKNTTIVFPVPIDVFEALMDSRARAAKAAGGGSNV
jgi:regulator of protease activity HflC (stomatin/prohibitin superfamily)